MKIREKLIISVNLILFIVFFTILIFNRAYIDNLYLLLKKIHMKKVLKEINAGGELSQIEEDFDVRIVSAEEILRNDNQFIRGQNTKLGSGTGRRPDKDIPVDGVLKKMLQNMTNRPQNQLRKGRPVIKVIQNRGGSRPEAIVLYYLDESDKQMLIVSPLTKIKEVLEILTYYSYLLLIMSLIASGIILSIFSYKIAKPLITIKGVANKMANLDFSEKIDIKSGDEVQELGESINNLSTQLETNIERLRNDIKEKEKANQIQRRFFSTVSHELKTPLAIIQGYASGLKDNVAPEKVDFYCEVINDEVKEMSDLITTLLSKMKHESEAVEREKIKLLDLVNDIVQKHKIDIEEKKIDLNINTDENVEIYADKDGIKTAILNFFTNALSFVSDGGEINIEINNIDEKCRVSIFNSGKNIPESSINDIWKPFYRVEESQNRKFGGTGLGLSIVKDIFEKNEAEYGVKNLENGVEFYFII